HPAHAAHDTLSLHDALPISPGDEPCSGSPGTPSTWSHRHGHTIPSIPGHCSPDNPPQPRRLPMSTGQRSKARPSTLAAWSPLLLDRKSTRLNSSHVSISYAV